MSEHKRGTFWQRVQVEIFGWTWIATWFAAIWYDPFRWQLFWTGAFCLAYSMLIVTSWRQSNKSTSKGR